MPLPGKRISRSRTRRRRAHHALKAVALTVCPNCKSEIVSHQACPSCGMWKGRQVLNVGRRMERLLKRAQAKQKHVHSESEPPTTKDEAEESRTQHEAHAHPTPHKHDRPEGATAVKDKAVNKMKRLFHKKPSE